MYIQGLTTPWCDCPGQLKISWGQNFQCPGARGCFTNVSQALQAILSKFVYCRNRTFLWEFQAETLCVCDQSHALGTRTKFQLEILTIDVISGIAYFHKIILESSWNVSETAPSGCEKGNLNLSKIPDFLGGSLISM